MLYWEYYVLGIILLPAILLAIYAQSRVQSTYSKYSKVHSKGNLTAMQIARAVLDSAGLKQVAIQQTSGHLTDNYNPKTDIVSLSSDVINSTSVAAIGIACHEVGHAIQHHTNYAPAKLRNIIVPICNFSSVVLWPLIVIGLLFNFVFIPNSIIGSIFLWSGVIFFGSAVLFNIFTLFSEYNASNRAIKILEGGEFLDQEELSGAKAVLKAAALTYLAALLVSILELARFLIVILSNSRRE